MSGRDQAGPLQAKSVSKLAASHETAVHFHTNGQMAIPYIFEQLCHLVVPSQAIEQQLAGVAEYVIFYLQPQD